MLAISEVLRYRQVDSWDSLVSQVSDPLCLKQKLETSKRTTLLIISSIPCTGMNTECMGAAPVHEHSALPFTTHGENKQKYQVSVVTQFLPSSANTFFKN